MPVLKLGDAEIHYQEYGSGFPILLFAPGGMRSEASLWHTPEGGPSWTPLPDAEMLVDWKGPDHIDEQRRRVVDFLGKHTP